MKPTESKSGRIFADGYAMRPVLIDYSGAGNSLLRIELFPADVSTEFSINTGFSGAIGKANVSIPADALERDSGALAIRLRSLKTKQSVSSGGALITAMYTDIETSEDLIKRLPHAYALVRNDDNTVRPAAPVSDMSVTVTDSEGNLLRLKSGSLISVTLPIDEEIVSSFSLAGQEQVIYQYDPLNNEYTRSGVCNINSSNNACVGETSKLGSIVILLPDNSRIRWACAHMKALRIQTDEDVVLSQKSMWLESVLFLGGPLKRLETRFAKVSNGALKLYAVFSITYGGDTAYPKPLFYAHMDTTLTSTTSMQASLQSSSLKGVLLSSEGVTSGQDLWDRCLSIPEADMQEATLIVKNKFDD